MGRIHTDCLERHLRVCFQVMGRFIGSHPWWFFIAPLVLSTSLGSGFYLLPDRMSNGIEEQFTPADGQAKTERKYIQETFPGNDSMFSPLRLSKDGTYATLIATSDGNVLTVDTLQDIVELDFNIRSMAVQCGNHSFEYADVCAELMGSCTSNDLLDIIEHNARNIDAVDLTFPWFHSDSRSFPLYLSLGSVKLHENSSVVQSAEAIQLYYYLQEDKRKADLWLERFIHLVSNVSSASVQVSRTLISVFSVTDSSLLLDVSIISPGVVLHLHVNAVGVSEIARVRHLLILCRLRHRHRVFHRIMLEVCKTLRCLVCWLFV